MMMPLMTMGAPSPSSGWQKLLDRGVSKPRTEILRSIVLIICNLSIH